MDLNRERLSEQEIQEKICEINQKIDQELLDSEKTDMTLVDEYFRQIRELDGMPEPSEAELRSEWRELCKKAAECEKRKSTGRFRGIGMRAAGIAAAILIAFTCTLTVSAVRDPFVSFCMNTYEKFTELFFDASDIEKAPQTIETVYTLGYVPEGYELDGEYIFEKHRITIWKNAKGDSIEFEQDILSGMLNIDNESEKFIFIDTDNMQVLYKEKHGIKTYFWNTADYRYNLRVIDDEISMEECMNIIQSIEEYKK